MPKTLAPRHVPLYGLYGENDGNNQFLLHCETIESRSRQYNWNIGAHRHRVFFQMLYINAGTGEAEIGDTVWDIRPPVLILIPPRHVHAFRFSYDVAGLVLTTPSGRVRALSDLNGNIATMLASPKVLQIDREDDDQRYLAETMSYIGREFAACGPRGNKLIDTSLRLALRLAASISTPARSTADGLPVADRGKYLIDLIARDCRIDRSVGHYAKAMHLSPAHLNRISVSSTGRSVRELILYELAKQAKQELVLNNSSIQEIAFALGFSDPAYFSNFFARRVGVSPRTYRLTEGVRAATENEKWERER